MQLCFYFYNFLFPWPHYHKDLLLLAPAPTDTQLYRNKIWKGQFGTKQVALTYTDASDLSFKTSQHTKASSSCVGLDDSYSKQTLGLYFNYCYGYKIRVDTGGKRRKRNKSTKMVNPPRKEGVVEKQRERERVRAGGWGRKRGHFNTQLNKDKQNNKNPSSSREIVLISAG